MILPTIPVWITSEGAAEAQHEGAESMPRSLLDEAIRAHPQMQRGCSRQRTQALAGAGSRGHIGWIIKLEENGGQYLHK